MNHEDPSPPPRRITNAQILVIAAAVVVVASLTTGLLGAATRVVDCSVCHSMRPYEDAHAQTGHASLGCIECHASRGVLGLPADGARAMRWIVREPFVDNVEPVLLGDSLCRGCHESILDEVIVSSVRVRHSDFEEAACGTCHGGAAHAAEGRWYIGPQMEDCLTCHRVSLNNVGVCDVCHPVEATSPSRDRPSAWRASHGPGWEQAHGMGDLSGCPACHAPSTCEQCHGVGLPHPPTWQREHGTDLDAGTREACQTCHEVQWCSDCHGVEMPHPEGFLPAHGPQATEAGEAACTRCHDIEQCYACHFYSSHPNFPSVGMSAFGGDPGAR
jgi:hypothetical protein